MSKKLFRAYARDAKASAWQAPGRPCISIRGQESEGPITVMIFDEIGAGDWFSEGGVVARTFVEDLAEIPKDREIVVEINSPGGVIDEGLAIYNALAERRSKVVVKISALAASISSVIALAGRELQMPSNAAFMVHKPWGVAHGNSKDMRSAADRLDFYEERMIGIYDGKSGLGKKELEKLLDAETWLSAERAKELGFVDVILPETFEAQASLKRFDLARFRSVPAALLRQASTRNDSASGGATDTHEEMNKKAILALLKKHGKELSADTPDAAILSALDSLVTEGKVAKDEAEKLKAAAPSGGDGNTAPPAARGGGMDPALEARIVNLERERDQANERARQAEEREITAELDSIVADNPAIDRATWLPRVLNDRSLLEVLRVIPAPLPGGDPVGVTRGGARVVATSSDQIERAVNGPAEKPNGRVERFAALYANRDHIFNAAVRRRDLDPRGANTLTNLTHTVLASMALNAFVYALTPLRFFAQNFSGELVTKRGNKVKVLYVSNSSTARAFTGSYVMNDADAEGKDIEVSSRQYESWSLTMEDLYNQPQLEMQRFLYQKGNSIAVAVLQDIWSLILAANYGSDAYSQGSGGDVVTVTAANFDSTEVSYLRECAGKDNWPNGQRGLVLDPAYYSALFNDSDIIGTKGIDDNAALANATVRRLMGFEVAESNAIPANGENLVGFACHPNAILIAMRALRPPQGMSGTPDVRVVTDPESGITLVDREWFEPNEDTPKRVLECNYGYLLGEATAIKRIKSS